MNILMAALLAAPFLAGGQDQEQKAKEAVSKFAAMYNRKSSTHQERIVAIQRLGALPHKRTGLVLQKLLRNRRVPASHKVEAARTLAGFTGVKGASLFALNGLVSRINAKNTRVRVALIEILKSFPEKHIQTLRALHKLAVEDNFVVAQAAIEAIPSFANRGSIKMMIDYLRKCEREPSNVKVGLKLPNRFRKPDSNGVDPIEGHRNIDIKITADEKQRLRHTLCYPALKESLRNMTGLSFQDWKGWNQWWRSGGVVEKRSR